MDASGRKRGSCPGRDRCSQSVSSRRRPGPISKQRNPIFLHTFIRNENNGQCNYKRITSLIEDKEVWIKKQDLTPLIETLLAALPHHKDYQKEYEQRLYERWKEPLDFFETTLVFGRETAAQFNQFVKPYAIKQDDMVFDVLARLHIRACQTGSAILSLLKSGHADVALASARTLHELHVTAKFINMHENDTAKRYRMYEVVESLKAAREYEEHHLQLNLEPLEHDAIAKLEELVEQYRTNFSEFFAKRVGKCPPKLAGFAHRPRQLPSHVSSALDNCL